MKKQLLALVFCLSFWSAAHAQLQKGSWMADGQVGLSSNNQNNESTNASWRYATSDHRNQFTLSPGIGYFIQDNLALGLSPVFTHGWSKGQSGQNDPTRGNSFGYGIGVFSRKYIPTGEKVSFFGDLQIAHVWGNSGWLETGASDRTVLTRSRSFEGSASIGIQYLIADFLGLHLQSALVSFQERKVTGEAFEGNYSYTTLSGGLFSSFQIGASVFF